MQFATYEVNHSKIQFVASVHIVDFSFSHHFKKGISHLQEKSGRHSS